MKKAIQLATLSAAVLLVAPVACKKPPAPEPVKETYSPYIGLWEGATKKGDVCSVKFTPLEWECHLENGGVAVPYYRGTYTHTGARIDMVVTQEADKKTLSWVPQKGSLGPNIIGRLAGGKLTIPALTDAELLKKR
jgi:hypothetical protein